jgi:hypothetical protein
MPVAEVRLLSAPRYEHRPYFSRYFCNRRFALNSLSALALRLPLQLPLQLPLFSQPVFALYGSIVPIASIS